VVWATSELSTLHQRFAQARTIITKVFRWQLAPGVSYQGFMTMLAHWQDELLAAVVPQFRERMQEGHQAQGETAGDAVFAGDGSRGARARSAALAVVFAPRRRRRKAPRRHRIMARRKQAATRRKQAAARRTAQPQTPAARQQKATSPQLGLTRLWQVGSGLPWAWRTGPSGASERDQLVSLVPELPAQALVVADAGCVGYALWQALRTAGHHFVIRVGATVRLVRQLGWTREHAQVVSLWPDQAARKCQPPLGLRRVVVQDGKQPV
jgi:hypothetical protein